MNRTPGMDDSISEFKKRQNTDVYSPSFQKHGEINTHEIISTTIGKGVAGYPKGNLATLPFPTIMGTILKLGAQECVNLLIYLFMNINKTMERI